MQLAIEMVHESFGMQLSREMAQNELWNATFVSFSIGIRDLTKKSLGHLANRIQAE